MTTAARERLFGYEHAFDHPLTWIITLSLVVLLVLAPFVIMLVARGKEKESLRRELLKRYYSWLVIVPAMLVPILLGAAWVIVGIGVLSLFCYREYARATGLFRERSISLVLIVGIVAVTLAVLDHWYRLFVALTPLTVAAIAAVAILADQPKGYIQRVSLGVLAFIFFGTCLGHLGYFANDTMYRPVLLLILLSVELNDVFAYIVGKSLGRKKLAPNTSPNKTIEGALGAVILTTLLVMGIGQFIYPGDLLMAHGISRIAELRYLAVLGIIISVVGQLGDLMISSIKRDLGLKDMGVVIPGHGGLLDRFDSIILVAPAAFHYINYIAGFGVDIPAKIFSGE